MRKRGMVQVLRPALTLLLLISPTGPIDGRYASNRARSPHDDMDPWFGDSSGALFAMYLKTKGGEGFEMAKRWEKCAVWLLCYGSVLMAVSCGLIAVSYLYIKPGSPNEPVPRYAHMADTSFHLALIINLTCVGAAGRLMECSRTYVSRISRRQANVQSQARVHAFFTKGAQDFRVDLVAGTLLALQQFTAALIFLGILLLLI
ncbi:hypothetical protein BC826DRAFT_1021846 [Russula brevipes]|nr:hypothetical protein BC826DRAFT_1021846 [Russula brevipes]